MFIKIHWITYMLNFPNTYIKMGPQMAAKVVNTEMFLGLLPPSFWIGFS